MYNIVHLLFTFAMRMHEAVTFAHTKNSIFLLCIGVKYPYTFPLSYLYLRNSARSSRKLKEKTKTRLKRMAYGWVSVFKIFHPIMKFIFNLNNINIDVFDGCVTIPLMGAVCSVVTLIHKHKMYHTLHRMLYIHRLCMDKYLYCLPIVIFSIIY
jgi:hypothetical protein